MAASQPKVRIRAFGLPDQGDWCKYGAICDLIRPWNNPEDDILQCLENPSSELLVAAAKTHFAAASRSAATGTVVGCITLPWIASAAIGGSGEPSWNTPKTGCA